MNVSQSVHGRSTTAATVSTGVTQRGSGTRTGSGRATSGGSGAAIRSSIPTLYPLRVRQCADDGVTLVSACACGA